MDMDARLLITERRLGHDAKKVVRLTLTRKQRKMVSIILVSRRSSLLWADWCEVCVANCAAEDAAAFPPPPPLFPLK